ncbi:MAG: DUF4965 domain-containing protein, partial [Bacteroidales bacterium]|nr:DUF4965 domain-containing protein [Bacteroidales bacterium]
YRLMGSKPSSAEPLTQTGLCINPTQTIYQFANKLVKVELVFTSPALPDDLSLLSRPVTYVTWNIISADGKSHNAELYFDCSSEVCVDQADQKVQFETRDLSGLKAIKAGSSDQAILQKQGDDLRIDWGFAWVAAASEQNPERTIGSGDKVRKAFLSEGKLSDIDNPGIKAVKEGYYCMALSWNLGSVDTKTTTRWAMISYDDLFSIRYFEDYLRPYWRQNGMDMETLLKISASEYQSVLARCEKFDHKLIQDLNRAGGEKYAQVTSLVYRECLAAHKVTADQYGQPLLFSKENFSNGCIATVDVMYPASPFFLLFSPALTKAMLKPIMDYSASARWKFPFAPHDLGTYPFATGQAYGGGELTEEDQMPVEETGNMLIMIAALAKAEGNASFAKPYWPVLENWAKYLISKGFDPENQLCTDDFAGHLAHNINLSAKAIVALASYSGLCKMNGKADDARKYRGQAESFAKQWVAEATEGNHTRLAYDQPGTWSQKYNLVWDKLLNLNLFPKEIIQKEIDYYIQMQGPYGLPLDNRERWTKTDWILWTATMAEKKADFDTLFNPIYNFINATPQRVPVTDWYIVDNAYKVGFQARPVIGGLFIKVMADQPTWMKWFKEGENIKPVKMD